MSIQGVGNQALLTQLQSSLSTQHAAKAKTADKDNDGDQDHGAIDTNDGGTKGHHIDVKA